MDVFALRFVKASLIYALLGAILGLYMTTGPNLAYVLKFAHVHFLLFGFVGMIIFGVGYHILPRFHGKTLHSPRLAHWHFWLANIGLLGIAVFWVLHVRQGMLFAMVGLHVCAAVAFVSFALFVYNLWRTISQETEG